MNCYAGMHPMVADICEVHLKPFGVSKKKGGLSEDVKKEMWWLILRGLLVKKGECTLKEAEEIKKEHWIGFYEDGLSAHDTLCAWYRNYGVI